MPGSDEVKPADSGVKLTYDDFLLFPDDGKRHELIDGEHYVTPSPNIRHQRISKRLLVLMDVWLQEHPLGEVFDAPLDVRFSMFDVVEPDSCTSRTSGRPSFSPANTSPDRRT